MILIRTQNVKRGGSDVANLGLEVFQFLLDVGKLLGHFLELLLPLITILLKSLNFAFEVAGLDVGLTQPVKISVSVSVSSKGPAKRPCVPQYMDESVEKRLLVIRLTKILIGLLSLLLQ